MLHYRSFLIRIEKRGDEEGWRCGFAASSDPNILDSGIMPKVALCRIIPERRVKVSIAWSRNINLAGGQPRDRRVISALIGLIAAAL
jgi:hypothetical protein